MLMLRLVGHSFGFCVGFCILRILKFKKLTLVKILDKQSQNVIFIVLLALEGPF